MHPLDALQLTLQAFSAALLLLLNQSSELIGDLHDSVVGVLAVSGSTIVAYHSSFGNKKPRALYFTGLRLRQVSPT